MIWVFLVGGVLTTIVIAIARASVRTPARPAAAASRNAGVDGDDSGSAFWSSDTDGSSDDGSRWSGSDSGSCDAGGGGDSSSSDCGGGDSGGGSSGD